MSLHVFWLQSSLYNFEADVSRMPLPVCPPMVGAMVSTFLELLKSSMTVECNMHYVCAM